MLYSRSESSGPKEDPPRLGQTDSVYSGRIGGSFGACRSRSAAQRSSGSSQDAAARKRARQACDSVRLQEATTATEGCLNPNAEIRGPKPGGGKMIWAR